MKSSEYRQSFLNFFEEHGHTIVPSSPLLPSAPNLLFTNAGMNQFVPYFLGEQSPPYPRAADTQKCIRAGGKHNDLEDVGFDTYHHTFFEMLGNWSFGDYFKQEALTWSWELLTQVWKIPKERLYVTVYKPGPGDPAQADQEAYAIWKHLLEAHDLDPEKHILYGGKADNFWMMGDTGPCGPCSEIHLDCTADGQTEGKLVNQDSAWCMEIWNNVFIQFNATADGKYLPLKSKHVDTGLGFERVAGIAASTNDFTEWGTLPSNYNSDLFTDFFAQLESITGHAYQAVLPENAEDLNPVARKDCGYRIVADHLRCLCCAIADGILPGNEGRNYVIRRILRRAVLWAERIGLPQDTLETLVPVTVKKLGDTFPELKTQETVIRKVVAAEEQAFNRTLDRGLQLLETVFRDHPGTVPGETAFLLYDTYGFPLDLTQLMAREKGRTVDVEGFEQEMDKQRKRARAAQKKDVIEVQDPAVDAEATVFVGFDPDALQDFEATYLGTESVGEAREQKQYLIFDKTPFYAEMGGQLGDRGTAEIDGQRIEIVNTIKAPNGLVLHQVDGAKTFKLTSGIPAMLTVDRERRIAIQRNHTATHLLNWALRENLGPHVRQAGSLVAPDHLRFDFTHYESVSPEILQTIEEQVNEAILHNDQVHWYEVDMEDKPEDVVAVFGEKYGQRVRVVDIGAEVAADENGLLQERPRPGYSAELCGGTHVVATGEIGSFKILHESSISAGTRRIEAITGRPALEFYRKEHQELQSLAQLLSCRPQEVESRLQALIETRKNLEQELQNVARQDRAERSRDLADAALEKDGIHFVAAPVEVESPNDLRELGIQIAREFPESVIILGAAFGDKCTLVALASKQAIEAGYKAGDLIRELTGKLDGKGGGKPDFAMGGAKKVDDLDKVLREFRDGLAV